MKPLIIVILGIFIIWPLLLIIPHRYAAENENSVDSLVERKLADTLQISSGDTIIPYNGDTVILSSGDTIESVTVDNITKYTLKENRAKVDSSDTN